MLILPQGLVDLHTFDALTPLYTINGYPYTTYSEMLQLIDKHKDAIAILPSSVISSLIKEKKIIPLPEEMQSKIKNIHVDFQKLDYDPIHKYTLPIFWGMKWL